MSRKKSSEEHTSDNTASQKQKSLQEKSKGSASNITSESTPKRANDSARKATTKETAVKGTTTKGTAVKETAIKGTAAKETTTKGTAIKGTTTKEAATIKGAAGKEATKGTTEEMGKTSKGQVPVQSLRKYNIRMLILSVAMLMALCVILLFRIRELNEIITDMNTQMGKLTLLATEQQERLQELTEELAAARENAGSRPVDGQGTGTAQGNNSQRGEENGGAEITAAHKVYLTFDDGPSTNTQKILDILDEYGVKATFFVLGKESNSAKESMKKIVEAGHTLAMHSYTHKYSELYESVENFAADFAKEQEYLYDVTGVICTVYRFPGGSSNSVSKVDMKDCAQYLDSQGVRFFDWNISSGDGGSYLVPVETLVENCTKNISRHSTSVILMHDAAGKSTTVEALPTIIETILEMDDTVILPITDETTPIQHIKWRDSDTEATE